MTEAQPTAIVNFLTARYDEIEAAADAATSGPWSVDSEAHAEAIRAKDGTDVVAGGRWGDEASVFESTEDALHIALHDPAYVLADIAAKRKILAAYAERDDREDYVTIGDWTSCSDSCPVELLERVLRILAAPFRAHADFDPAWTVDP